VSTPVIASMAIKGRSTRSYEYDTPDGVDDRTAATLTIAICVLNP